MTYNPDDDFINVDPFGECDLTPSQESMAAMPTDPNDIVPNESPADLVLTPNGTIGLFQDREHLLKPLVDESTVPPQPVVELPPEELLAVSVETHEMAMGEMHAPIPEIEIVDGDDGGEHVEVATKLQAVYDDMSALGGIDKSMVMAAEAVIPGIITDRVPLGMISSTPSESGLVASTEGLSESMRNIIKRIVEYCKQRVKAIVDYIKGFRSKWATTVDGKVLLEKRRELIDKAKRIDTSVGRESLTSLFGGNDPIAARSGTVVEYATRYLDHHMVKKMNMIYTSGFRDIHETQSYSYHIQAIYRLIQSVMDRTYKSIDKLKGSDPSTWRAGDNLDIYRSISNLVEYAKVKPSQEDILQAPVTVLSNYRDTLNERLNTRQQVTNLKLFANAANFDSPFKDVRSRMNDVEKQMVGMERSLDALSKKVSSSKGKDTANSAAVTDVSNLLAIVRSLITCYASHMARYVTYYTALDNIAIKLDMKLTMVVAKVRSRV